MSRSFSRRAANPGPSILELTAQAIREGRHSNTFQTVCGGCGQWVHGIYHVTEQHKRLCRDCAIKAGAFKPAEGSLS